MSLKDGGKNIADIKKQQNSINIKKKNVKSAPFFAKW